MDADRTLQVLLRFVTAFAGAGDPAQAGAALDALARLADAPGEWTADERRVLQGVARLATEALERDRERIARHQLALELLRAQRLESVGRLAGGVAHDFNNLLTAMIGYMDLVAAGLPPESEEQGYIAQALDAAEQATELTRQMLAFVRRQPASPTPQDLGALLERLGPLVRRLMPEGVRFVVPPPGEPAWLLADPGQVEQVVVNLALRARDAMTGGGVLTLGAITFADPAGGPGWVALEAADTGVGMDAETLRRALEPVEAAGEERPGLELAIAAALVGAGGGRLEAESDPAGGTRVRALWPLAAPPGARPEPAGAAGGAGAARPAVAGRETVLFVEDDASVRELAASMLSRLGYPVITAGGADEALRWLAQHAGGVRLLIADLVLPGMSGRELAQRAREAHPGLRVLLTSGYASSPGATEVAGGLPFLAKPFTSETLARRVRETLDAPPA